MLVDQEMLFMSSSLGRDSVEDWSHGLALDHGDGEVSRSSGSTEWIVWTCSSGDSCREELRTSSGDTKQSS